MSMDRMTESGSRVLANSISRRSFLGRLGAGLTAVGAGSLSFIVATPEAALACAHSGHSTSCGSSTCPTGTCSCGSWYLCQCTGPRLKRYRDCCATCSTCTCGADGYPKCCYTAPYGSCSGHHKVKCRTVSCTSFGC